MTWQWDFSILSNVTGWTVLAALSLWVLRLVAKRKWVPEATLKDEQADTAEWRSIAFTTLETNRKTADLMEEVRVLLRANEAYLQALPQVEGSDEQQS